MRTLTREQVERAWIERQCELARENLEEPEPLVYAAEFREFFKGALETARAEVREPLIQALQSDIRVVESWAAESMEQMQQYSAVRDGMIRALDIVSDS